MHTLYLQLLLVNCALVSGAAPRGLSGALCQKCNSDLWCCFSCFCAGPERAVHTARDGPNSPRQPDPSHREERYLHVNQANVFVCLASPSFRLRATVSLPPSAILLSCQHLHKCRLIGMWIQSGSHRCRNAHTCSCTLAVQLLGWLVTACRFHTLTINVQSQSSSVRPR